MAELKQYKFLLSLVALLILAKFIIVPIYDWQEAKQTNINQLNKKLTKINSVISGQSSNSDLLAKLQTNTAVASKLFYVFSPEAQFKISQQKHIETMLEKYSIRVSNFGWQPVNKLEQLNALHYQAKLRFTGSTVNLIKAMTFLESQEPYHEISEFNYKIKRQSATNLGTMDARVTLSFYVKNTQAGV
ncbi:hypothetical protein KO527_25215 [Pseudoalteromonas sp. C2R02]|uniref:hypothetical protein n=1 Tax=Pseudoalteromonas sp. C2R02 TaxID=2841565 RepID=UPI001C0A1FB2|nr:hypothetical protein [Pseudoalteromonas sp. C2R02]MBU2972641.1 hypothetical protein [Pseudoalteromonas sp. C2R02]